MRKCELNVRQLLHAMIALLVMSGGMMVAAVQKIQKDGAPVVAVQQQRNTQALLESAVTKLFSSPQLPLTVAEGDALVSLADRGIKDEAEKNAFVSSVKRAVRVDLPPAADQPVSCCPSSCDSNLQKTLCLIRQLIGNPCDEGTLFSLLCFIRAVVVGIDAEAWSIESKAEVISSKLDNLDITVSATVDLSTVYSKLDIIIDENWSIESKAEVISSKIDAIDFNVTATVDLSTVYSKLDIIIDENWSIESKAEVISSKIDTIPGAVAPELWSIESKSEVISSKIDDVSTEINNDFHATWTVLQTIIDENWSIESKAEVISSKIDTIPGAVAPELWSIESKSEVISSKIDDISTEINNDFHATWTVLQTIIDENWSIESKAEVISSKIDDISTEINNDFHATWTVLQTIIDETWSIESKAEAISSKIDDLSVDFHDTWTIIKALDTELWSIESKAEVISSKVDDLAIEINNDFHDTWTMLNGITGETWSIESKSEAISSKIGQENDTIYAFSASDVIDVNATTTLSVFQWLKLIYQKVK